MEDDPSCLPGAATTMEAAGKAGEDVLKVVETAQAYVEPPLQTLTHVPSRADYQTVLSEVVHDVQDLVGPAKGKSDTGDVEKGEEKPETVPYKALWRYVTPEDTRNFHRSTTRRLPVFNHLCCMQAISLDSNRQWYSNSYSDRILKKNCLGSTVQY